jgi:hypothetical protein
MGYVDVLGGRRHKRLPLIMVVRLGRVPRQPSEHVPGLPSEKEERTFTDNVSAHGARVVSKCAWQPGEKVEVTSLRDGAAIRGKVVYCQHQGNDRFFIGLDFGELPLTWSLYKGFDDIY